MLAQALGATKDAARQAARRRSVNRPSFSSAAASYTRGDVEVTVPKPQEQQKV